MKVRNGFVSNSSSSSFLMYGIEIDSCELEDRLKGKNEDDNENEEEEEECDDVYELVEKFCEGSGLGYWHPTYRDCYYIGSSWDQVEDNQTGKQFKEEVEKKIKEKFGEEIECHTFEEAWHD